MTISNDLFLAILAMDSYNRGYNAGVNVTGNQIGNAILGRATDADLEPNAVDRKSTRLNSSHSRASRMPSSA